MVLDYALCLSVSNVLVTDYLLCASVSQTTFLVKWVGYRPFCCFHLPPRQLSVSIVLVTDYLLFPSVSQTTFCVKCLGYRQFAVSRLFAVLTVWASGLQRLPRACSMLRSAVTELCCEQTRNVRREILTHIFLLTTSHRGRVNLHFTRSGTLTKQAKECHRGW